MAAGKNRLRGILNGMKTRCNNPNRKDYSLYGGSGITVCDEWSGAGGFENFYKWSIDNGYRDDLSIDRIDSSRGYSPDNCRWVDMKTQSNNKRCCHYITHNGKTQTLKQWCEEKNLKYHTIFARIVKYKWPIEKALEFN